MPAFRGFSWQIFSFKCYFSNKFQLTDQQKISWLILTCCTRFENNGLLIFCRKGVIQDHFKGPPSNDICWCIIHKLIHYLRFSWKKKLFCPNSKKVNWSNWPNCDKCLIKCLNLYFSLFRVSIINFGNVWFSLSVFFVGTTNYRFIYKILILS